MALSADELLARMDASLLDLALGDIRRASRPGELTGAKMAGFLLGFCFIDAAAGFYRGRTKQTKGKIGEHFKAFVCAYMPEYDPPALYADLRSGLVHSYAIGKTYAFTHLESDGRHFEIVNAGTLGRRKLLNLENFVNDIEQAYRALREDIQTDAERFAKAAARYESIGLIAASQASTTAN